MSVLWLLLNHTLYFNYKVLKLQRAVNVYIYKVLKLQRAVDVCNYKVLKLQRAVNALQFECAMVVTQPYIVL